jgi:hypothetical protein
MLSVSRLYIINDRMINVCVEQYVKWELARETEVLRENFPVLLCLPHISHDLTWDQTWVMGWEAGNNYWRYGIVSQRQNEVSVSCNIIT